MGFCFQSYVAGAGQDLIQNILPLEGLHLVDGLDGLLIQYTQLADLFVKLQFTDGFVLPWDHLGQLSQIPSPLPFLCAWKFSIDWTDRAGGGSLMDGFDGEQRLFLWSSSFFLDGCNHCKTVCIGIQRARWSDGIG